MTIACFASKGYRNMRKVQFLALATRPSLFKVSKYLKLENLYTGQHVTNWQQIKQLMVSQSLYSSGHQGFRSVSAKKLPWTTLQDKCNASKWPQIETLSVCVRTLHLDFREYAWTSFAWEFPLTTGLSSPSIQTPSNAVLHWPCPKRASKLLAFSRK